jgi:hypothetical protein
MSLLKHNLRPRRAPIKRRFTPTLLRLDRRDVPSMTSWTFMASNGWGSFSNANWAPFTINGGWQKFGGWPQF